MIAPWLKPTSAVRCRGTRALGFGVDQGFEMRQGGCYALPAVGLGHARDAEPLSAVVAHVERREAVGNDDRRAGQRAGKFGSDRCHVGSARADTVEHDHQRLRAFCLPERQPAHAPPPNA